MTPPLTYNIEQAAERLGPIVTVDWLRKHLRELPHLRAGNGRGRSGRAAFTEAHLVEIIAKLERRPDVTDGPEQFSSIVSRGKRRSA